MSDDPNHQHDSQAFDTPGLKGRGLSFDVLTTLSGALGVAEWVKIGLDDRMPAGLAGKSDTRCSTVGSAQEDAPRVGMRFRISGGGKTA